MIPTADNLEFKVDFAERIALGVQSLQSNIF